jgi:hypothetical protein
MLWKSGIGMAVFYEGLVSYNEIRLPTCRNEEAGERSDPAPERRHVPKGKPPQAAQRQEFSYTPERHAPGDIHVRPRRLASTIAAGTPGAIRNPRQAKMAAVATRTLLNLRMVVPLPALHVAGYLRTLL